MECEENDYKVCNIIEGFNVYVEPFNENCDFEVSLRKIKPNVIIMFEPYLEFMRAIEIYNAERIYLDKINDPVEVYLLIY